MIAAWKVPPANPKREYIDRKAAFAALCYDCSEKERNKYMTGCSRFEEAKPQTNADRIRAMSDDEMAKMCYTELGCPKWCGYPDCGKTPSASVCTRCWLEWLKQEVET